MVLVRQISARIPLGNWKFIVPGVFAARQLSMLPGERRELRRIQAKTKNPLGGNLGQPSNLLHTFKNHCITAGYSKRDVSNDRRRGFQPFAPLADPLAGDSDALPKSSLGIRQSSEGSFRFCFGRIKCPQTPRKGSALHRRIQDG